MRIVLRLIMTLIFLVVLFAVLVFAVLPLVPLDGYKPRINAAISQALGREVRLNGPIRLQVIPALGVSLQDVELDNAPGGSEPVMARLESLRLNARLLPLLGGNFQLDSIQLVAPDILLEVLPDGRPNWVFDGVSPNTNPAPDASPDGRTEALSAVVIDDLRLSNGRLRFADANKGIGQTIENFNARASVGPGLEQLALKGDMVWQGLPMDYDLRIASLGRLLDGETSDAEILLSAGQALEGDIRGALRLQPSLNFQGPIRLATDDLPALAKRAGTSLPQATQLRGPLSLSGDLALVGQEFAFTAARATADIPALAADFSGRFGYQQNQPNVIGNFSLNLKDAAPVTQAAEVFFPGLRDISGTAAAQGQIQLVGQDFDLSGLSAQALLSIAEAQFKGRMSKRGDYISAGGQGQAAISDLAAAISLAAPFADQSLQDSLRQLSGRANLAANIQLEGQDMRIEAARIDAQTNLGRLQFDGQVARENAQLQADGQLLADIPNLAPVMDIARSFSPDLPPLTGRAQAKGQLSADGQALILDGFVLDAQTNVADINFSGDVRQGPQAVRANGSYRLDARDLQALVALSPVALPGLDQLSGQLKLSGRLTAEEAGFRSDDTQIVADTNLGKINGSGRAWLHQALGVDMQLSADIPSLDSLTRVFAPGVVTGLPDSSLSFDGRLLQDGARSQLRDAAVSLSNNLLSASFSGAASFEGSQAQATGQLAAQGQSLRALLQRYGVALPGKPDRYGAFDLRGTLSHQGLRSEVADGRLSLDGTAIAIAAALDLGQGKPYVQVSANAPQLALDPYLFSQDKQPVAQTQGRGWSQAPIDWTPLRLLNADFALRSGGLEAYGFQLTSTQLEGQLRDGRLETNIRELGAYSGSGSGRVVLNAREAEPSLALDFDMRGVQVAPLYRALTGRNDLEGRGQLRANLLSWGVSQAALMSNMRGEAYVELNDGAVRGFDVPSTLASLRAGDIAPALGANHKTRFGRLYSTASINQGVLSTQGFELSSDNVRMTGSGDVNLGRQTLNYRLEPQLKSGFAQAAGLGAGISQLKLPVVIRGPWSNVSVEPDLSGLLNMALDNPEALLNLLPGDLANKLLPGNIDLKGLVSDRQADLERAAADAARKAAEEAARLRREAEQRAAAEAQRLADQARQAATEAAQKAAQEAERLRRQAEQRALAEAERLRREAEKRLQDAQQSIGGEVENAIGDLLNGLF